MKHSAGKRCILPAMVLCLIMLGLAACGRAHIQVPAVTAETAAADGGQIYLYGELHSEQAILDKELELWQGYYAQGLRHLFVEMPCYTAGLLNHWMQAEDDAILEQVYANWEGTLSHDPSVKEFYRQIKQTCPETVFHGFDVGHQYETSGAQFLELLEQEDARDSAAYAQAENCIQQGETYYAGLGTDEAEIFRENAMAENFLRQWQELDGASVMATCGSYHAALAPVQEDPDTLRMAGQLEEACGTALHIVDLTGGVDAPVPTVAKTDRPIRTDTLLVAGKEYAAACYGEQEIDGTQGVRRLTYWHLEDAYQDFAAAPECQDYLPCSQYPMEIEAGQVYAVEATLEDGSSLWRYYRSDGDTFQGEAATTGFTPEN